MKTINLKDFAAKVKELADKKNAPSYIVEAKIRYYLGEPEFTFNCYCAGFNFHSGASPNEAYAKLKAEMFPKKYSIADVAIELTNQK